MGHPRPRGCSFDPAKGGWSGSPTQFIALGGTRGEEPVGQAPPYKEVQLRQTNPIQPGRATVRGPGGRNVQNEPNSRIHRAGRGRGLGREGRDCCTNKPNLRGGAWGHSLAPAKPTVPNKPNWHRGHFRGQVVYGHRVMVNCACAGLRRNKAN